MKQKTKKIRLGVKNIHSGRGVNKSCELAIIIVSYKSDERTIQYVIKELSKCSMTKLIVIVNNQATEESSKKIAKELAGQVIKEISHIVNPNASIFVIHNEENSGYAKGNNLGAKFIKEHFNVKYLLFSNDDIIIKDNDVVEKLVEKIEQHPDVGIIGPKVIGTAGEPQTPYMYTTFWHEVFWHNWQRYIPFYHPKSLDREKADEGYYYRVVGAFFLVRSVDFYNCGMMDPNTFLFYEEQILAERMLSINKRVYYYPDVCAIHIHGQSINNAPKTKQLTNSMFNSCLYYFKQYKSVSSFSILMAKICNSIYVILKSVKNCAQTPFHRR